MSEEQFDDYEYKRRYFYCGNCGKRLEHENADVAGYGYGRVPACSYKCQCALVAKYEGKKPKITEDYVPEYNRRYVKIDPETYEKIISMRKRGCSAQIISSTVGHCVSSIYNICNRAGLPYSRKI